MKHQHLEKPKSISCSSVYYQARASVKSQGFHWANHFFPSFSSPFLFSFLKEEENFVIYYKDGVGLCA